MGSCFCMWEPSGESDGVKIIKMSDIAMRSCWDCNGAHEHLKNATGVFYCFSCGRCFANGGFIIPIGGENDNL